jgi:hypothetical protein
MFFHFYLKDYSRSGFSASDLVQAAVDRVGRQEGSRCSSHLPILGTSKYFKLFSSISISRRSENYSSSKCFSRPFCHYNIFETSKLVSVITPFLEVVKKLFHLHLLANLFRFPNLLSKPYYKFEFQRIV